MISSQRLILKACSSIINFNAKTLTHLGLANFASDDGKYQNYEVPFNFNRQEYRGYIKKVEKAKKQIAQVEQLEAGTIIPRRKRRVYDKPKFDTDITAYAVWRLFDPEELYLKTFQHSLPVMAKLHLQPKWLIHAVGQGLIPTNNPRGSHRQFVFEDNNLSKFILYEYRNTTHFKENIPDFDYENQQHLRPQMRKIRRLQPQQFWQSEQFFQFRLNCTSYAQHLKFCKWIQQTIAKSKTMQSYDAVVDEKFGKAMCYNEKQDMQMFEAHSPFIMHVNPQSFQVKKQQKQQKVAVKGKKQKQTEKKIQKSVQKAAETEVKVKQNYNFSYKLDEKYRRQAKDQKVQKKKAQSSN